MAKLPLFPLPETVVFPGMTIPLYIFEERYKQMVKDCLEQNNRRIVIVLAKSAADIRDTAVATFEVGSFVDILSVAENPDGAYNILVHGQERCKVAEIDTASHPYASIEGQEFELERGDPNLERVTAWDTLDTFKTYAKAFFTASTVAQIEEALPEDLIYQASFICANIRVPAVSRQVLLEAPSLTARFQIANKLMQERLEAHLSVKPGAKVD